VAYRQSLQNKQRLSHRIFRNTVLLLSVSISGTGVNGKKFALFLFINHDLSCIENVNKKYIYGQQCNPENLN
jgi:hypothetical protein